MKERVEVSKEQKKKKRNKTKFEAFLYSILYFFVSLAVALFLLHKKFGKLFLKS
jgi:hypothetical protein